MAITVVSSAGAISSGGQPSVTIPATSVLEDDFIFAYAAQVSQSSPVLAAPSGYTDICSALAGGGGFQDSLGVYKQAAGGEEDDVLTWTSDFNYAHVAGVVVLRGVDTSTPFDVTVTHGTYHVVRDNDTSPACASITTATNGAFVIACTHLEDAVGTVTDVSSSRGGATEFMNGVDTGGVSGLMTYEEIATAGAVTNEHTYADADSGADAHTFVFAVRPAAAASGRIMGPIAGKGGLAGGGGLAGIGGGIANRIIEVVRPRLIVPVGIQLNGA